MILDDPNIESAIKKLSNWIETAPGDNEEAAGMYFLNEIIKVLEDPQNDEIDELNVLMFRLALFNMKDHVSNKTVFNFWEVMTLTMACLDITEMNQLECDREYSKVLIEMPEYGTEESQEFIQEFKVRLKRRMFLCTMVTGKAK